MSIKNKQVTTVSGKLMARSKTRRMRTGEYYAIGRRKVENSGDCYKIGDKYYAFSKGKIAWDHENKQYELKSNMIQGIVTTSRKEGYFTSNNKNVVCHINGGDVKRALNYIVAEKAGFNEKFSNGEFYDSNWKKNSIQKIERPSSRYKDSLPYSCADLIAGAEKLYKKNFSITAKDRFIEKTYLSNKSVLDKYTFGVEFETTAGMIPQRVFERLGIIPVRDGSITGIEYVTIPLNGLNGLYTLKEFMDELKKRTTSDYTCSMHIHVSGMERNNENILAMFKFFHDIQDSVYSVFPLYKKNNMGAKRKNYTSPLSSRVFSRMNNKCKTKSDIVSDMEKLIYYLSAKAPGYEKVKLEQIKEHPSDPNNSRKWQVVSRYVWCNLIPIIFSNKKTVEFRIFTMPDNTEKMVYMLLMTLYLIDFAIKHSATILEFPQKVEGYNLFRVLNSTKGAQATYRFFSDRKEMVEALQLHKGLLINESDIPTKFTENFRRTLGNDEGVVRGETPRPINLETPPIARRTTRVSEIEREAIRESMRRAAATLNRETTTTFQIRRDDPDFQDPNVAAGWGGAIADDNNSAS